MYYLIRDICGYARELKASLAKMAYQVTVGIWQHPERKVTFQGGGVGRLLKQIATVHVVEKNFALEIMPSHEGNAVDWSTLDQQKSKDYLRRSTYKNWDEYEVFLKDLGESNKLHKRIFKYL